MSSDDNAMGDTERLYHHYYCTHCQEIVGVHPKEHRDEEHDGRPEIDVHPIEEQDSDGRWIAKSSDMGHFTPHVWMDIEGQEMCGECGAVRIAEEVVERYVDTGTERSENTRD